MKSWWAAVFLVVLPALAGAQSLADAARQERERREKVREAGGSTRTLTEEDLASTKGTLANDPTTPPATTGTRAATPPRSSGGLLRVSGPPLPSFTAAQAEAYWRTRIDLATSRVQTAQRARDALQRMIRIRQPGMHDANGQRVIYSIHQMKTMADAADAELAAAQAALEAVREDGRRAGAQPGWLR